MRKARYVCLECQSTNILRDAYAAWDFEKQEWIIHSVYDDMICADCGSTYNPENMETVDE